MMRTVVAIAALFFVSLGCASLDTSAWAKVIKVNASHSYDASRCGGDGFPDYDYDYRYAYSEIACASDADPHKAVYFLTRRDLRKNRSDLIDIGNEGQEFTILGLDRNNHLYWMPGDTYYYTDPQTELSIRKTNLMSLETDIVTVKLARPAVLIGSRGYYNGGYLIQAVDHDGKRMLHALTPEGNVVAVLDEVTAPCAYRCELSVPNTFYSPFVVFSYTKETTEGGGYLLKGMDKVDGLKRSTVLNETEMSQYEVIVGGDWLHISFSQAGDRFVMNEGIVGRQAYDKRYREMRRRNYDDTSQDNVLIYDAQRRGNPFFMVKQPYYGRTAMSPDGRLFYRLLPNSISVRRISDGKEIWSDIGQTSDAKFLDNQTLLLNDGSHSTIVTLP